MKVIFRGDPIELERGEGLSRLSLDLWGVHFKMGEVVDVSRLSAGFRAKLAANPHFEVVAEEASAPAESPTLTVGASAAGETYTTGGRGKKSGTVKAAKE